MKLNLTLRPGNALNFQRMLKEMQVAETERRLINSLAGNLIGLGADAVARAGWMNMGPNGQCLELRPWTPQEWLAHCLLTGQPLPTKYAHLIAKEVG